MEGVGIWHWKTGCGSRSETGSLRDGAFAGFVGCACWGFVRRDTVSSFALRFWELGLWRAYTRTFPCHDMEGFDCDVFGVVIFILAGIVADVVVTACVNRDRLHGGRMMMVGLPRSNWKVVSHI